MQAGQEHVVSFEYNMPITQVFLKAVTGNNYMLNIGCVRYVAYDNYNEVPVGTSTIVLDGTNYYLDYNALASYRVTAITMVFEVNK